MSFTFNTFLNKSFYYLYIGACIFFFLVFTIYALLSIEAIILQDTNPFCLSANDKDMVLLISNPGPPNLDVSR